MALPLQLIIGFIFGATMGVLFSKQFKEIVGGIINPKQKGQVSNKPIPTTQPGRVQQNTIMCSQGCGAIKKEDYLYHLKYVHGIDVEKWVKDQKGGKPG